MLYKYKGFGLCQTCNYYSPSKWVITTSSGATISKAWTLEEAKKKVNEIIEIRKEVKKNNEKVLYKC